jgi:hypothetical protein
LRSHALKNETLRERGAKGGEMITVPWRWSLVREPIVRVKAIAAYVAEQGLPPGTYDGVFAAAG